MQSRPYPELDQWAPHPGTTAGAITAAFRDADDGYPLAQCDLFEGRVSVDGHLRALLEYRTDAVAKKPWVLQEGGPDEADKQAARLLEERLRLVPNFLQSMEHQLSFNAYGYAHTEVDWQRLDGLTAPSWFENVAHRRFVFDQLDRPRLLTKSKPADGVSLLPGKWWSTTRAGRITAATGLLRTAVWWSYFKSLAVRDWMVYANRFGIPFVNGLYDDTADETTKRALRDAVKQLGSDGWAIFSKACEISIHETKKSGGSDEVHAALTNLCDSQNSKLIAGATLLTETQGPGSFALGKVHQGRGFDLVAGDAERISQSFEMNIGLPFVRYNGMKARPPRLKIYVARDMDPVTQMKVASIAANELGLELDEDQIRQMTLLRAPTGKSLVGTNAAQSRRKDSELAA